MDSFLAISDGFLMRYRPSPSDEPYNRSDDLFRARLDQIIRSDHPLVRLADAMPWVSIVEQVADLLPPKPEGAGRASLPVRMMVGLLYLKYAYNLSDDQVLERWLESPYMQHFTGEVYFQHELPCDPSSLTRWRNRLDEAGAEELLAQTIEAAKTLKAIRPRELRVVSIDTTVQEKNVAHPTDSRLLRDIDQGHPAADGAQLAETMHRARRLKEQKTKSKNKLYAFHVPEVKCISKGKARQTYEFGVKASFAVTAQKSLIVGARSFPDNPYDGDTLAEQLEQTAILTDTPVKTALVDLGYCGREVDGIRILHRGKPKHMSKAEKRPLKRRQAVEPSIGHLKADHRMYRNFLKGGLGDAMTPILAAAGFNIRCLMRWLVVFWRWILSAVLRLLDQGGTDVRSNPKPAPA